MAFGKKNIFFVLSGVALFLSGAHSACLPEGQKQTSLHSYGDATRTEDPCSGKEDGTMLPDPDNCQYFFVCYDGESALASCLRRNCFDADTTSCRPCAGCDYPFSSKSQPIEISVTVNTQGNN